MQKVKLSVVVCYTNRTHSLISIEHKSKGTGKIVPVNATNAHRGSRGIAPFILKLGTKQICMKTVVMCHGCKYPHQL
jgi:hypothetical protein